MSSPHHDNMAKLSPETPSVLSSNATSLSDTAAAISDSNASTCSSASSTSTTDLPSSAFDGSHLHWRVFRQHVLAPYRIRIVDGPLSAKLPETLLSFIEVQSRNIERFDEQKISFRQAVTEGRGFGPSPIFPPHLLPTIENEPQLARCMIPTFSREALPERAQTQHLPLYELSVPRSGLGCGFGSFAFSNDETAVLPSWLVVTGTSVDFGSGYISPGAAIYCPFLTFERAYGNKEHRLEAANNQCAIGGAWACRALQMLYELAYAGAPIPSIPVTFSCTVDNEFAIINHHWIDPEHGYYMSPLCKFDLRNDGHFSHFVAWIDAIGQWALTSLLPHIKQALAVLQKRESKHSAPSTPGTSRRLTLTIGDDKNAMLIKSLKTTFEGIPWRFEDDSFTPVSSSTASWGSPMVDDMLLSTLNREAVLLNRDGLMLGRESVMPILKGPASKSPATPRAPQEARFPSLAPPKVRVDTTGQWSPPPAYAHNPELVWQRRFNHAMDEIRDLQAQVQALKRGLNGSSMCLKKELSGMRNTLGSMLRKESVLLKSRSLSLTSLNLTAEGAWTSIPTSPAMITEPPSPRPKLPANQILTRVTSSPLPRSRLHKLQIPPKSPTMTLRHEGVDYVVSPKKRSAPFRTSSPLRDSLRDSPTLPTAIEIHPPTPRKETMPLSPPATPVETTHSPRLAAGSTTSAKIIQCTLALLSGYALHAFLPSKVTQVIVLGCIARAALQKAWTSETSTFGGFTFSMPFGKSSLKDC